MLLAGGQPSASWSKETASLQKTVSGVVIHVRTRTPEQIVAFYEARGFPPAAQQVLANHCFIGVSVRNQSGRVVWLEPGTWKIVAKTTGTGRVSPLSEQYWHHQWDRIALPSAQRSTFKWTRLPGMRDLRPNEPVGGNLAIPRIEGKFSLDMTFVTGANRNGSILRTQFTNLQCPRPQSPKNG